MFLVNTFVGLIFRFKHKVKSILLFVLLLCNYIIIIVVFPDTLRKNKTVISTYLTRQIVWNHQTHTGAGAVHNHFLSVAKTKREILHSYRQRSKGNGKKIYFKIIIIIIFPCGFFFRPFLSSIGIPFYIYAHTRCATKRDLGWRPTEAIMGHRWNRLPVEPLTHAHGMWASLCWEPVQAADAE